MVVTAVLTQPAAATAEPVMAAGAVETEIDSDAGGTHTLDAFMPRSPDWCGIVSPDWCGTDPLLVNAVATAANSSIDGSTATVYVRKGHACTSPLKITLPCIEFRSAVRW